jgi:hypothetical protein
MRNSRGSNRNRGGAFAMRALHSAIVGFPTSKPVIVHLPRNERLDARYYSLFDGPHRQPSIDKTGALLIADNVGNTVWRVSSQRRGKLLPPLLQALTPRPCCLARRGTIVTISGPRVAERELARE